MGAWQKHFAGRVLCGHGNAKDREREREREIDSIISYRSGGNNRIFALLQSPNKHWGGPGGRGVSQTPHALQKIEI